MTKVNKLAVNYRLGLLVIKYYSEDLGENRFKSIKVGEKIYQRFSDGETPEKIRDEILKQLKSKFELLQGIEDKYIKNMLEKLIKNNKFHKEQEERKKQLSSHGLVNEEEALLLSKDLNKLNDSQLNEAKLLMSREFELNRLSKGDDGYQHEINVDHPEPTMTSDWD